MSHDEGRRRPLHLLEKAEQDLREKEAEAAKRRKRADAIDSAKRATASRPGARLDRRLPLNILGGLSGSGSGTAGPTGPLSPCVAPVPVTRKGTIEDVKHVVILMMENRSFDEYFGTFPGVNGFCDPTATDAICGQKFPQGTLGFTKGGILYPWHMDTTQTYAQVAIRDDHGWVGMHAYYAGGAMNGWGVSASANAATCMGYYTEADVPYHWALAHTFTICDRYFSSMLGPTSPNRFYLMSGMIDPTGEFGGPVCSNAGSTGFLTPSDTGHCPTGPVQLACWDSYPALLSCGNVTWAIYEENMSETAGLNVGVWFEDLQPGSMAITTVTQLGVEKGETVGFQNGDLMQFGYDRNGQVEKDLCNGTLPTVSWIIPPYSVSEHPPNQYDGPLPSQAGVGDFTVPLGSPPCGGPLPPPGDPITYGGYGSPACGAAYVADKIGALLRSAYWDNTVFIIIYDECDGHFDHVIPRVPACVEETVDGKPQTVYPPLESITSINALGGLNENGVNVTLPANEWFPGPIGPGFRVPCIIISPWTVNGGVCSIPFDHTSVLRFLGSVTGVRPKNISDYRMDNLFDLSDAFDFLNHVTAADVPALPDAPGYTQLVLRSPSGTEITVPPLAAPSQQVWPPEDLPCPPSATGPIGYPSSGGQTAIYNPWPAPNAAQTASRNDADVADPPGGASPPGRTP
jgi:phospholipase C